MIKRRGKWTVYAPVRPWVKRMSWWPATRVTLERMMGEALDRAIEGELHV